ncbi:ALDH-like protein, partial [Caulochytrium protostelioides]
AGYINGQWTAATSGATFPVYDPASRERLIDLPAMGAEETRAAIDAAQTAFATWQTTTARDRATVLHEWHRLLMANADVLARLMTLECGKPLAEARGEVAYGASFLRWFAEEASRTYGRVIPATMPGRRLMTQLQPVGVCGLITPWNFPNAMITRKVAPALAAGCTAVIKPAAETPLSALALAALGAQAGVPAGVCNIVLAPAAGAHHVGTALTTHPSVRKISFTGSTAVGKQLLAQAAQTVKRVSMELG